MTLLVILAGCSESEISKNAEAVQEVTPVSQHVSVADPVTQSVDVKPLKVVRQSDASESMPESSLTDFGSVQVSGGSEYEVFSKTVGPDSAVDPTMMDIDDSMAKREQRYDQDFGN